MGRIYSEQAKIREKKTKKVTLQIVCSRRCEKQKNRSKLRRQKKRRKYETKSSEGTSCDEFLWGTFNLEEENVLLSKALSICPNSSKLDENQLLDDLESFFRQLHLSEFFLDGED